MGEKYIASLMVSEELDKINVPVSNIISNFSNLTVKPLSGARRQRNARSEFQIDTLYCI